MQTLDSQLNLDCADALRRVEWLGDEALDRLRFGVIGFDATGVIRRYNACESSFSGLRPKNVIGRALFTDVAQCMNNYLIAQRFQDAWADCMALDATIDYVLTWRMRPTKVQMRLLCSPDRAMSYLLLRHH
ncbi:PAS domain-containing protein [Ideonella azotifigens]|uniref:PAS fold-4 domain-containing protein n=2 Tax=Ideonella azotifigens TaxID=513160 RepID=A0ABP3VSP7_9BURK|nr:PAS domain-containing protein [Ideonella azotifigens]